VGPSPRPRSSGRHSASILPCIPHHRRPTFRPHALALRYLVASHRKMLQSTCHTAEEMDWLRRQENISFIDQESKHGCYDSVCSDGLQVHPIATLLSSKFDLERKARLNWALVSCGSSFMFLFPLLRRLSCLATVR
jgi:hypothetical protein